MQVFKTYFKIMNKVKVPIIMYICIFLGVTFVISGSSISNGTKVYETASLDVAVIDRDESVLSGGIKDYIAKNNKLVELKDDEDKLKDALYLREVKYIVIIPEGFMDSVVDGKPLEIETRKIDGTSNSQFLDANLSSYISTMNGYIRAGYDMQKVVDYTAASVDKKGEVSIIVDETSDKSTEKSMVSYYFSYAPYAIISVTIMAVSLIMSIFNQEDIKKRNICSALSLKKLNSQIILAGTTFSLALAVLIIVGGIVISPSEDRNMTSFIFYGANVITCSVVGLSIAYCLGNTLKTLNGVNGACNIVGLGSSFLGGVFVPLEILPDSVVKLANLVPTYWYTRTNDVIGYMSKATSANMEEIFKYMGVQLLFALVFFAIGLVSSKRNVVFC